METPNLSYIKQLSGGDFDFENQIITIVKKEFPTEVLEYTKSIQKKDFQKTAENVHKLKHKISILGLEKGYELATNFEKELKNDSDRLQKSFEKTLTQISVYLNTI